MFEADAIELSTEAELVILAIAAILALVLSLLAAVTAWGLARRRVALPLGVLAFWVGAWTVGDRMGAVQGLVAGWLSSAAVGLVLAVAVALERALVPRDRGLPPDDQR